MEAVVHRAPLAIPLALAVLLSCTVVAPQRDPNPYLPLAALQEEPATRLAMPTAEVLSPVRAERFMNITGPEAAFTGALWGTAAGRDEVFAFYDQALRGLGWQSDFGPGLSTIELDGRAWCRPRLFYRLTIVDPTELGRTPARGGERFRTVFDATVRGIERPCPYTPPPMPSVP
ncbi:MAG: hypothetical protein AABZ26_00220 [Chloroflexota bacterium]